MNAAAPAGAHRMPLEWGKVREFARATGADAQEYTVDPHTPIPPTFLTTVSQWAPLSSAFRDARVAEACHAAGVPFEADAMLALGQELTFLGEVPRAGTSLDVVVRLDDVKVTSGRMGPMVIVTCLAEFHHAQDGLRAELRLVSAFVGRQAR
jgi:hypothetical protein